MRRVDWIALLSVGALTLINRFPRRHAEAGIVPASDKLHFPDFETLMEDGLFYHRALTRAARSQSLIHVSRSASRARVPDVPFSAREASNPCSREGPLASASSDQRALSRGAST